MNELNAGSSPVDHPSRDLGVSGASCLIEAQEDRVRFPKVPYERPAVPKRRDLGSTVRVSPGRLP